jgi:hypothetical protein
LCREQEKGAVAHRRQTDMYGKAFSRSTAMTARQSSHESVIRFMERG